MQVQVNTDKNIEGSERLTAYVQDSVESSLSRFGSLITRVEVHLSDVNSHKEVGDDKKCVMEARPSGRKPVVVTHQAPNVDQAIDGAAEKLQRVLESDFGKLGNKKGRTSYSGD